MPLIPAAIAVALCAAVLFTLPGCRQSGGADFWSAVSREVGKQEKR